MEWKSESGPLPGTRGGGSATLTQSYLCIYLQGNNECVHKKTFTLARGRGPSVRVLAVHNTRLGGHSNTHSVLYNTNTLYGQRNSRDLFSVSQCKVAISEVAVYSVRDKLVEIYRIYTTDRIYHTIIYTSPTRRVRKQGVQRTSR